MSSELCFKICSLTFLDRRIAAGMPSSRGEDWQPLLMYRNSLVHGETDQPPVTSKRAYSRKKKEYAGELFLVIYHSKRFSVTKCEYVCQSYMFSLTFYVSLATAFIYLWYRLMLQSHLLHRIVTNQK
jgi:hypothetical protein